jgi:hypothetical protein
LVSSLIPTPSLLVSVERQSGARWRVLRVVDRLDYQTH